MYDLYRFHAYSFHKVGYIRLYRVIHKLDCMKTSFRKNILNGFSGGVHGLLVAAHTVRQKVNARFATGWHVLPVGVCTGCQDW